MTQRTIGSWLAEPSTKHGFTLIIMFLGVVTGDRAFSDAGCSLGTTVADLPGMISDLRVSDILAALGVTLGGYQVVKREPVPQAANTEQAK